MNNKAKAYRPTKLEIAKVLRASAEKERWGNPQQCSLCNLFNHGCVACSDAVGLWESGEGGCGKFGVRFCDTHASSFWYSPYIDEIRDEFRLAANAVLRARADELEREAACEGGARTINWRERAMRAEGEKEKLQTLIASLENEKDVLESVVKLTIQQVGR